MAEPNTTPTPDTTPVDIAPQEAATKIEGLLDKTGNVLPVSDEVEDGPDTPAEHDVGDDESDGDEPSDIAQEETPASDDDQADQSETTESSIAPPNSWSAQEKQMFATLPPEVQSTIARRESERDQATQRGMQQIAEHRKAIDAQVVQASQAQNQYVNTLNQLLTLTVPELQEIENADMMRLSQENPNEYIRLSALRDTLKNRVGFMQQEMSKVQQQQQYQALQQHHEHLAQQYDVLVSQVPDFRDATKATALVNDITSTMSQYGFAPEEVSAVADARVVKVMARLAKLEKAEAAKASAMNKRTGTPAQRVIPASAPSQGDSGKRKVQDQFAKLKRTGSPHDAAKLIEQLL